MNARAIAYDRYRERANALQARADAVTRSIVERMRTTPCADWPTANDGQK